jgi:MarR family transcriptional regulator, organic hydroperoxide resistance regulator
MPDYIQQKGPAALGTRLRRLSEQMDREIQNVYGEYDLGFEPRWFPIVSALSEYGPLSVGDLADLIGVSHPAVSQLRVELVNARLVRCKADPTDGRRQLIVLTPGGKRQVSKLRPIWDAITEATKQLCSEAAPHFLNEIDRIEAALREKSMKTRVSALHPANREGAASAVVSHG